MLDERYSVRPDRVVHLRELREHGARLDLFAAAMLGYFDVVTTILSDFPEMREALGPHGIPLVEHARVGGADARAVLELLEATEVSG